MLQESVVRMFFGESHMWRVVLMCAQKIIFVNFARAGLIMRCYRPWYKNKRGRGDFNLLQIDCRLSNSCIARLVVGCEECGRLLAVAFRPKTPI